MNNAELPAQIACYHPFGQHPEWCLEYADSLHFISDKQGLQQAFQNNLPIIAFCATGIVIRQLAPLLQDKWQEPPLLVILGEPHHGTIIPLLGAHHGGNQLARLLANLWHMRIITSSATDSIGIALDDVPIGWLINPETVSHLKPLAKQLLQQQPVQIFADKPVYAEAYCHAIGIQMQNGAVHHPLINICDNPQQAQIIISPFIPSDNQALHIIPPVICVGIGSIRHADAGQLQNLLINACQQGNILPASILAIGSVSLKNNEPALHQLAQNYQIACRFFTPDTLIRINVPNPSKIVQAEIGCPSVAEACALALTGANDAATQGTQGGSLCLQKIKNTDGTCAIAIADNLLQPDNLAGQACGVLTVVGLGPGDDAYRLPKASHALAKADIIIGYQFYLDLIRQQFTQATYHDSPIGAEQQRADQALQYALAGNNTVLVASGDPGIYALATLVVEQAKKLASAPMIEIIPGITAMQMLAARSGALMGHDFCAISLSDLLTDPDTIVKRIHSAAEADFVIAFYNPQSQTRRTLLPEAIKILQQHRPHTTPVMVGRHLGRKDEKITACNLQDLNITDIDMFCVVLIGNSQSEFFGKKLAFTPRGYKEATKMNYKDCG